MRGFKSLFNRIQIPIFISSHPSALLISRLFRCYCVAIKNHRTVIWSKPFLSVHIDVGDGWWRQNALSTSWRCWCPICRITSPAYRSHRVGDESLQQKWCYWTQIYVYHDPSSTSIGPSRTNFSILDIFAVDNMWNIHILVRKIGVREVTTKNG